MKTTNKNYEEFITRFLILKKENKISSNQIHTLFCSVFDLNPAKFSIKGFMSKFITEYERIHGIKLVRTKQRLGSAKNSVRCVLGISLTTLESFSQVTNPSYIHIGTTTTLNTEHTIEQSRNTATPITSSILTNDGTIKEQVMEQGVEYNGTRISLTKYMKTFQPGTEKKDKYSLKYLFEDYKNFYKESPLHLNYISSTDEIREKFNLHWDLEYPNNKLDNKARLSGQKRDKSIGGLKKL